MKPLELNIYSWMDEDLKAGEKQTLSLNSKFWKTVLISLAAVLIFAGPTYMVLIFWRVLDIDYALSMVAGLLLFLVGMGLLAFLIKRR
ncbi:MAG: hypothetical protein QXR01_02405 [Candidatus Bathyarchaeia archaeon]